MTGPLRNVIRRIESVAAVDPNASDIVRRNAAALLRRFDRTNRGVLAGARSPAGRAASGPRRAPPAPSDRPDARLPLLR